MVCDLTAGRHPDVLTIRAFLRDFIVGPRSGRTAITMGVTEDIEDDDVVARREQMTQCLIKQLYELPRRPSPTHRVGKVVQFDRQRYGDEISLWIFLQVRQIVVQGVTLPFIAVSNEAPKCVVARRRTGADPPRRLRPDDLGKPGSSAT